MGSCRYLVYISAIRRASTVVPSRSIIFLHSHTRTCFCFTGNFPRWRCCTVGRTRWTSSDDGQPLPPLLSRNSPAFALALWRVRRLRRPLPSGRAAHSPHSHIQSRGSGEALICSHASTHEPKKRPSSPLGRVPAGVHVVWNGTPAGYRSSSGRL